VADHSRTKKPSTDLTKDSTDILGVDKQEIAQAEGAAHIGWNYTRTIGSRRVWETLVAMKNPPTEDPSDNSILPGA